MKKIMVCAVMVAMLAASAVHGNAEDLKGGQCGEGRIELAAQPESCPCCGFSPVARIMYGVPRFTEELKHEIAEGRIALGGCMLMQDPPRWMCRHCQRIFHQTPWEPPK